MTNIPSLKYAFKKMLIPLIKNKTPLIDLRAPIEFSSGTVPTSINLPILFDEERSIVGKIKLALHFVGILNDHTLEEKVLWFYLGE